MRSRMSPGDVGFATTRQSCAAENDSRSGKPGSAARTSGRDRRHALTQKRGLRSHGARAEEAFTALLFPHTIGSRVATGHATVQVNLPPVPAIAGDTIDAAFCTLAAGLPSPIGILSTRLDYILQ